MDKKIFIIIPIYNRCELTRQCLQSIVRQTYQNYTVVIVDDGSTDGTDETLKCDFPDAVVLKGDGNFFWTKSMNAGLQYVMERCGEGDYVLTLNNDLTLPAVFLSNIVSCAEKNPDALIGSLAVDQADAAISDGGVLINWWSAKFRPLNRGRQYEKEQLHDQVYAVDALPGRGTLIPVKVFKQIGLYNHDLLPQYGADYEFSVRAKRGGFKLLIDYACVVFTRTEETGLNNLVRQLTWKEWVKSFFSKRSPNAIPYRWRFAWLCRRNIPQGIIFFICDMGRVFFGSLRNQLFNKRRS